MSTDAPRLFVHLPTPPGLTAVAVNEVFVLVIGETSSITQPSSRRSDVRRGTGASLVLVTTSLNVDFDVA
jgi:hypothetical protein